MRGVPHNAQLGIAYRGSGENWAELELPFAPHLLADPDYGVMASGPIFALMDTASGMSVFITRKAFEPHATLDLRVDYLRSPRPEATVIGRAECYRMTRQIAFVRGIAHDGDPADPIANVAGTFMFTAPSAPGMFAAAAKAPA
nr:PaaI family thioesterase [Sandarakinorhabdus sp.]